MPILFHIVICYDILRHFFQFSLLLNLIQICVGQWQNILFLPIETMNDVI